MGMGPPRPPLWGGVGLGVLWIFFTILLIFIRFSLNRPPPPPVGWSGLGGSLDFHLNFIDFPFIFIGYTARMSHDVHGKVRMCTV